MASSGNYVWNPEVHDIVTDAYERCGIEPDDISSQMFTSALYSLNGVMAEVTNMQLNLWEVQSCILSLTQGVRSYQLPEGTIDVLEAYRRSFTRQLGGDPASSAGGTADYAFDGNVATSCQQTTSNGNISYDYGSGNNQVLSMVGYQSAVAATLTLVYEGSSDGIVWNTVLSTQAKVYGALEIVWEVVLIPNSYQYYRVRETGGAILNATEVYFANDEKDYPLGRLSRQEYDGIAFKTNQGIPVSFYIERTINPFFQVYMTPDNTFTMIKYNRIRQIQTITAASQTMDAPFRFIEALTAFLAVKLAMKKSPERLAMLKQAAQESINLADMEDRERVKGTFVPDLSGYRI